MIWLEIKGTKFNKKQTQKKTEFKPLFHQNTSISDWSGEDHVINSIDQSAEHVASEQCTSENKNTVKRNPAELSLRSIQSCIRTACGVKARLKATLTPFLPVILLPPSDNGGFQPNFVIRLSNSLISTSLGASGRSKE